MSGLGRAAGSRGQLSGASAATWEGDTQEKLYDAWRARGFCGKLSDHGVVTLGAADLLHTGIRAAKHRCGVRRTRWSK